MFKKFFLFSFCFSATLNAAEMTKDQAVLAVKGWLKSMDGSFGQTRNSIVTAAESYADKAGKNIFYKVDLGAKGFVITSADDEYDPIISFSNISSGAIQKNDPLYAMLSKDPRCRIPETKTLSARSASKTKTKWMDLMNRASSSSASRGLSLISDIRVAPLVKTEWSQGQVRSQDYYNRYTPKNYVCGCVATAMAQLMFYHKHPTAGIGRNNCSYYVDGVRNSGYTKGGDGFGGAYQWSDMPEKPDAVSVTAEGIMSVGKLCYDAGLSVSMWYSSRGSGAYSYVVDDALRNIFQYSSAFEKTVRNGFSSSELNQIVCSNLDAELPLIMGVGHSQQSTGHEILCDGYGYNSDVMYHHLNMGWAGYYDLWYNLPNIDSGYSNYNVVDSIIYNIYPSGSGGIISGRVLDEAGTPLAGATVKVDSISVTSDSKGIYALPKLSAGEKTITISKSKYDDKVISRDLSENSNLWNVDCVLSGPADLTPYCPSGWSDKIVLSTVRGTNTDSVIYPDSKVYVDLAFKNEGCRTTDTAKVAIYLDEVKTPISFDLGGIKPDSSRTWQDISFSILTGLPYGKHQLKVVIDEDEKLDELNELNNSYTKNFYVSPSGSHGEISNVESAPFIGGVPQSVNVKFFSYRLGAGNDCVIECSSLPAGWTVSPTHYSSVISADGTVHSKTFMVTPPQSGGSGSIVWKFYDDGVGIHPAGSTLLDTYTQSVSAVDTIPEVITGNIWGVEADRAVVAAEIMNLKGQRYSLSGIEVSESQTDWSSSREFNSNQFSRFFYIDCTGLVRDKNYYCRAFCVTNVGGGTRRGYGSVKSFKTKFAFDSNQFQSLSDLENELALGGISNVRNDNLQTYQEELIKVQGYTGGGSTFVQSLINAVNEGKNYKILKLESGWNLVSPPVGDFDVSKFMEQDSEICSVFDYGCSHYQLCRKDDSGKMILRFGKAYWFFTLRRCAILAEVEDQAQYKPVLSRGWNLLGPPASIKFTDLCNCFDGRIYDYSCWGWNPGQNIYERANMMELGKGYWIKAAEDAQVIAD